MDSTQGHRLLVPFPFTLESAERFLSSLLMAHLPPQAIVQNFSAPFRCSPLPPSQPPSKELKTSLAVLVRNFTHFLKKILSCVHLQILFFGCSLILASPAEIWTNLELSSIYTTR